MTGRWEKVSDEVLYVREPLSVVSAADIAAIKEMAGNSARGRARLCTHQAPEDSLHEMLVAIDHRSYIRPHRHFSRPESLLVLEGRASAVFFSEAGDVERVARLAPYKAGGDFYYRIETPIFHTLLLETPCLVMVEASLGPYDPARSEFAAWSPAEGDQAGIETFRQRLLEQVAGF